MNVSKGDLHNTHEHTHEDAQVAVDEIMNEGDTSESSNSDGMASFFHDVQQQATESL